MRKTGKTAILLTFSILTACATMGISLSSIEPGTRPVSAQASEINILGLNPISIERINELRDGLLEQCDGGAVTGVVARMSTTYAIIGVIEKVEVSGYCVQQ